MGINFNKNKSNFGKLTIPKNLKTKLSENNKVNDNKSSGINLKEVKHAILDKNHGVKFDSSNIKDIDNDRLEKLMDKRVDISNSKNKTEKFSDVKAEMDENVPDQTSTIEEKEKALEYINRMLACDDISPEMNNYWTNKKNIIEMEIQNIKNTQQKGQYENWQSVAEEYNAFTSQYLGKEPQFNSTPERAEYWVTFYTTCQSFIQRILNSKDVPEDVRSNFLNDYSNLQNDINNHLRDLDRYNAEKTR